MLSLPYTAKAMGWSALILLVILLIAFMYSYVLLANAINTVTTLRHLRHESRAMLHVEDPQRDLNESCTLIDYTVLGKEAFGPKGDKIVLGILGTELFLALVSFFINIGINLNVIFSGTSDL
jgi:amino acid permease